MDTQVHLPCKSTKCSKYSACGIGSTCGKDLFSSIFSLHERGDLYVAMYIYIYVYYASLMEPNICDQCMVYLPGYAIESN